MARNPPNMLTSRTIPSHKTRIHDPPLRWAGKTKIITQLPHVFVYPHLHLLNLQYSSHPHHHHYRPLPVSGYETDAVTLFRGGGSGISKSEKSSWPIAFIVHMSIFFSPVSLLFDWLTSLRGCAYMRARRVVSAR